MWPEQATPVTQIEAAWDDSLLSGEHAAWIRDFDPIIRFVRDAVDTDLMSKEDLLELDARVQVDINNGRAFGEASDYPDPQSSRDNTFAA